MVQQIKLILLFLLLISSCTNLPVSNQEQPKVENKDLPTGQDGEKSFLNLDVKKYTLSNGLRVLILENHKLPILSYYTFFGVGARNETKGLVGATHFLEHMMFKGAKKYGPGKFDSSIESSGGSTNAYTSYDITVYHEKVPSTQLEKIIDMEADRMSNLLLEPEAFEKERSVILEERKLRYENSPNGQLFVSMMKEVYKGTPYGQTVLGTSEQIKEITRDNMLEYFKQFYAPNNAVLVVAGDVESSKVFEMIKKRYGNIPASKGLKQVKEQKNDPELYKHNNIRKKDVKIHAASPEPIFSIVYKGEPKGSRRGQVIDILTTLLGNGESSYLNQSYVKNRKPLLNYIYSSHYSLKYNGLLYISGRLLKGVGLKGFKRKILKDLRKMCKKAVTGRNVQKVKNQYLVGFYKEVQTNSGIAEFIGSYEHYMGDYSFFAKELEIYQSIGTEEVMQVCNEIFGDDKYIFLSLWERYPKTKKN